MKTFIRRDIAVATLILSSATFVVANSDYVHEMAPKVLRSTAIREISGVLLPRNARKYQHSSAEARRRRF